MSNRNKDRSTVDLFIALFFREENNEVQTLSQRLYFSSISTDKETLVSEKTGLLLKNANFQQFAFGRVPEKM